MLLLIIGLAVQFAFWIYAQQAVRVAAQDGATFAATGADVEAGTTQAAVDASRLGGNFIGSVTSSVCMTGAQGAALPEITVTGRVTNLFGISFIPLGVSASAIAPVQDLVGGTPGSASTGVAAC